MTQFIQIRDTVRRRSTFMFFFSFSQLSAEWTKRHQGCNWPLMMNSWPGCGVKPVHQREGSFLQAFRHFTGNCWRPVNLLEKSLNLLPLFSSSSIPWHSGFISEYFVYYLWLESLRRNPSYLYKSEMERAGGKGRLLRRDLCSAGPNDKTLKVKGSTKAWDRVHSRDNKLPSRNLKLSLAFFKKKITWGKTLSCFGSVESEPVEGRKEPDDLLHLVWFGVKCS